MGESYEEGESRSFWRYVDSLGINQANSIVKVGGILRERAWQLCVLK